MLKLDHNNFRRALFSAQSRAALLGSVSAVALTLSVATAHAQSSNDIGSVDVKSTGNGGGLPISAPNAVGSAAPPGSAPALSPSQGNLQSYQAQSIVSDKVIRDIIAPSSDYNETGKLTPGFFSNNPNGLIGDSKSGWRGFVDGQFNITFDGIPFGDANDPTHHSAAYFPGYFLGGVVIDRGPGSASQVGYATFGGTMALRSIDLSNTMGGNVTMSYGSFNTFTTGATYQSGLLEDGTRAAFQYYHGNTSGALQYGDYLQNQYMMKLDHQFDNFKVTFFGNYGLEDYNNVTSITYNQWQTYGKTYGAVNSNPKSQQFYDYNNSKKQTDMEYLSIVGDIDDLHIDNNLYTYAYWYPGMQNNGNNQTIEGNSTIANGGTITSVKIPTITGGSTKYNIVGVANGDVTGYIKYNDYRAFGDILKFAYDVDAGIASGQLRTGIWLERVDNGRYQQYTDYTSNVTYTNLGNAMQPSYKLLLTSHIDNVQPFVEYAWKPIAGLTITPGFKYESFTRDHNALVNQTTLQNINVALTYTASLPFISLNYQVTNEISVYAQASQGFLAPTVSAFYVFNPTVGGIKPQTTNNYQMGAVYKDDRFTGDADIYQITAANFPITTVSPTGLTYYQNGGTARYQGIEAEGTYAVVPNFAVFGSGALISAKFISGANQGLRTQDAPSYTAAAGLLYDDGAYFGSLTARFIGDYYGSSGQTVTTSTANGSLNHVNAYNTEDFVIGVRTNALEQNFGFGTGATVRFGITNIFDKKNITEIGGSPNGLTQASATNLTYQFLPGRIFFGSVAINF